MSGRWLPNYTRAKARLNAAILASCWGRLEWRLEDKATASEGSSVLVRVDPRNTSRTCTQCGRVAAESRESQAVFRCVACDHEAHADINASRVIRTAGESLHRGLCGRAGRERARKPDRKPAARTSALVLAAVTS